jgi:hypothetical protein
VTGSTTNLPCAAAVEGPTAGSIARSDNARAKTVPIPRVMDAPGNSGSLTFSAMWASGYANSACAMQKSQEK